MKSKESKVAAQVRLNQWALEIRDCMNRPRDMTISEWCEQHNITKANYYWRLKRVRQAYLEQVELSADHFVELPAPVQTGVPTVPPRPIANNSPSVAVVLHGSPVSATLATAVINSKYVNAVPLYRTEKEFERYGICVNRKNMAHWMIRLAEEYLGILYDYLHQKLYEYHIIQADETPCLVNKDGRPAGSKSYMWVYLRLSVPKGTDRPL